MESSEPKRSAEIIDLNEEHRKRDWDASKKRLAEIAGPAIEEERNRIAHAKANAEEAAKEFDTLYAAVDEQLKSDTSEKAVLFKDVARLVNIVEYIENNADIPDDIYQKMRALEDVLVRRFSRRQSNSPTA